MRSLAAVTLVLFLVLCTTARGQTDALRPEVVSEALSAGFTAKDAAPLHKFLRDWETVSDAVASDLLAKKPAFERAVYGLYPAFFVPVAAQVDAKHLIIQSSVNVHLVEGNLAEAYRKELETYDNHARRMPTISDVTIRDFRPAVAVDRKKVLYLNDRCAYAILQFLTGKEIALDRYWDEPNGHNFTGEYAERNAA
jgi:hypothetical protein